MNWNSQSGPVYYSCDGGVFGSKYEFIPPVEKKIDLEVFQNDEGELDPVMEEKLEIIEKRPKPKKGKKEKPKKLPGQRLMKKLSKQQQIEKSLQRVIKTIVN